jgi:hypothetical protein
MRSDCCRRCTAVTASPATDAGNPCEAREFDLGSHFGFDGGHLRAFPPLMPLVSAYRAPQARALRLYRRIHYSRRSKGSQLRSPRESSREAQPYFPFRCRRSSRVAPRAFLGIPSTAFRLSRVGPVALLGIPFTAFRLLVPGCPGHGPRCLLEHAPAAGGRPARS